MKKIKGIIVLMLITSLVIAQDKVSRKLRVGVYANAGTSSLVQGMGMNMNGSGPDCESEQWVSEVAKNAGVPFMVLQKIRHGDSDVEVSVPQVEKYKNNIPVLVDDIISTARTMIETVGHLKKAGMKSPVCIGVHAVFSGNAFEELKKSGIEKIITCNPIPHSSNGVDVALLIYTRINKEH